MFIPPKQEHDGDPGERFHPTSNLFPFMLT